LEPVSLTANAAPAALCRGFSGAALAKALGVWPRTRLESLPQTNFQGWNLFFLMIVRYIQNLEHWMNDSPWIDKVQGDTNPEIDSTSFRQLVPILLTLLTVFTALQLIGGKAPLFFSLCLSSLPLNLSIENKIRKC
jgi:hypothetical protein